MNNEQLPRLGIDIGRVIMAPTSEHGGADTSFLSGSDERAMQTPPSPDAFEVITQLCQVFEGRVWLVSKCGPRIQELTRRWLHHWRFHEQTGLPADQVRFCLQRQQKALHASELGLTHFIDDRVDVLEHLRFLPRLFLFGYQERPAPDWTIPVLTWKAVRQRFSLGSGESPAVPPG